MLVASLKESIVKTVSALHCLRTATGTQRGFTLVELLVVLTVTGILLTIGLPQLNTFSASRATGSHVSLLASAVRLARSEAVKRGTPVSICPSLDPEAVGGPACSGGANDWASGWVTFSDLGALGVIEAGDRVIRIQSPLSNSGGIQSVGGNTLSFFPTGIAIGGQRTINVLPALTAGTPAFDDAAKRLCVENTGSTRASSYTEAC